MQMLFNFVVKLTCTQVRDITTIVSLVDTEKQSLVFKEVIDMNGLCYRRLILRFSIFTDAK